MPLAEILIGSLGPAIAKSLLKVWLKDQELAADVGSELIDLLKQKGLDIATQRAGRRAFEKIGDEVAQSLAPLFRGSDIDENGKEAVALAVGGTLDQARITAALLAEKNLEPRALARFFLDSRPGATRDFSAVERALYERIVQEVARRLVEIATQLPGFQVGTLGEVLKREERLLAIATETLRRVRELEEASRAANPSLKFAEFETRYREAVVRNLDRVQLIGVDVSATSREQCLSAAYVSLRVAQRLESILDAYAHHLLDYQLHTAVEAESTMGLRSRGKRTGSLAVSEGHEPTMMIPVAMLQDLYHTYTSHIKTGRSVEEALIGAQRLLVRGVAGSGKTTFLKWIAVSAAGRKFTGSLERWNDAVPFFLPLREYVDRDLPTPKEFPRPAAPTLVDEVPDGWVRHCLQSGRAIVLVDSVDEVPQAQRAKVREWLNNLVTEFKQSIFVVTSRPSAIEEGWLERELFEDAELLPMLLHDILAFVDHWHEAVQAEARDEREKIRLEELKHKLKQQIAEKRSIQRLATNPLLCAALCALHRERTGQVPSDRIELYEACCQMLLERRGRDQGLVVESKYFPDLTYREKRALLEDLAYWMMRNGRTEVPVEEAREQLERTLHNMTRLTHLETDEVLLFLVERSGIIREPRVGYVDYIHRTFQEFLAAQAAVDQGDIGLLIQQAEDDLWQETILLAAGLAKPKDAERLVRGLIKRGDTSMRRQHRAYMLAVACLETAVRLSGELKQAVDERLKKVVPPTSKEAALAVAKAGELAVPYLKAQQPSANTTIAVSCIQALAAIGGDIALAALKSYQEDTRSSVVQALFDAADSFDRETYFRDVLARLKASSLELFNITSLDGFQFLTSIQSLSLISSEQVGDLKPLAPLTNLASLILYDVPQVSDLTPLASLTNLTSLALYNLSQVSDLGILASLTNLTSLDLRYLEQLSDLTPLASLTNLTSLALDSLPQVSDLSILASLTNLTSLALYNLSQVSDLSILASLTNLTSLVLYNLSQVSDLSILASLTNLTSLALYNLSQVSDLSILASLTNLTSLALYNLPQVSDLGILASLTNLTSLDLRYLEQLSDLTPLASLTNLTALTLDTLPQVQDLGPLAVLPNLTSLTLHNLSRVSVLSPLTALTNLTTLDLHNLSQVSDLSPLAPLTNLTTLWLWGMEQESNIPELLTDRVRRL